MGNINFRQISPEIRKSENNDRKVVFVASDATRDTAGTVLNPYGWQLDRFNKNGIIGYQHKVYGGWDDTDNPDNVIGKGRAYVEDGKLMVEVEFEPAEINPLAEKVYQKILFGSLKAVSVGFLPVGTGHWGEGEEAAGQIRETYYYAGQELLEVSVVNIPANPNALKKSIIDEAMEAEKQRIHAEAAPAKPEQDDAEKKAAEAALEIETVIARAALLV